MGAYGLSTMYNFNAEIGVSKSANTWTYAPLNSGFDNITEALNEVVQQYQFLSDGGFARNHVTGMAPVFTFTGKRVFGDTAQDYIFSKKYSLDTDRQSSIKLTFNNGTEEVSYTCDCTICNIQEFSGATTDDSAISVEIRLDGKPVTA